LAGGLRRRFSTREERVAALERYLAELRAEAQAVEEHIAELKAL
jgi:cell division protein FtsB